MVDVIAVEKDRVKVRSFKDLQVWNIAMDMVDRIYDLTDGFPKSEIYGLTSQIRRSAVSIPSNIAEGSARKNTKELVQFLYIGLGSVAELYTQLEIAKRRQYGNNNLYPEVTDYLRRVNQMLNKLINSLL